MTTKELIQQYVTAHADNRWMDASELEALLTEFAEKLKESASEDFGSEWKRYCDSKGGGAVTMNVKDVAKHFAQWQREQMMKDAIEATALNSDYPTRLELNTKLNNVNAMDEVKVIIIKE